MTFHPIRVVGRTAGSVRRPRLSGFRFLTPTMITRDAPTMRRTVIYVLIMALLAGAVLVAFRHARGATHRAPYTTAAAAGATTKIGEETH
jgi:hypothetical protein